MSDHPSKEHLDYAEKKADEQMRHHLEDMAILNKESHVTFAFAAAALSAAFGYLLKLFNPERTLAEQQWRWLAPVLALNLWLAGTATYCLLKTLRAQHVAHPGNLPQNLLEDDLDGKPIEVVRHRELYGVAGRIEENRLRNQRTARALNRTRALILLAPIIFLAVWAAVAAVGV